MSRVLIVEDEPTVLRLVQRILGDAGIEVLVATNAQDALVILATSRVDALLTDVVLPEMRGPELILAARARHSAGLPACCMTGYGEDVVQALEGTAFLKKPFTPRDLIQAVQDLLHSPQSAVAT